MSQLNAPSFARTTGRSLASPGLVKIRGMGLWGYVFALLLIAVAITVSLRIGPHYMNHRTIVSIIQGLPSDQVHRMGKREIRDLIKKRLKINAMYDVDPNKVLHIERAKGSTKLLLNYEVREPMVHNIDAVVRFEDEFEFK